MNKILKIEEVNNLKLNAMHSGNIGFSSMLNVLSGWGGYDGYKVSGTKEDIYLLIDNGQSCCEDWGYFSTEDDTSQFIGAEILGIELTDTSLKTEPIEQIKYLDCGGVQFVTFKTSKGIFQLAVYNAHNGYYGHGVYVFRGDECLLNSGL